MTKTIKLQLWTGVRMVNMLVTPSAFIDGLDGLSLSREERPLALRRFTGMVDRDGVDIYERDIVECELALAADLPKLFINEVVWCSLYNQWRLSWYSAEYYSGSDCRVIGNTYENPELHDPEIAAGGPGHSIRGLN